MYVKATIKIHNEGRVFSDSVLVDTETTGIIVDERVAEELGLQVFGEVKVVTLGSADIANVVIEDVEIGPRRILACGFPGR